MAGTVLVENIKKYAKKKGYSITEIESILKFSPGLISRWKNMSPSLDKIIAVSELLGVSIDVLTGLRQPSENAVPDIVEQSCDKLISLTRDNELNWREFHEDIVFYNSIMNHLVNVDIYLDRGYYCKYGAGYFVILIQRSEPKPEPLLLALADVQLEPCLLECAREQLISLIKEASPLLYNSLIQLTRDVFLNDLVHS